MDREEVNLTLMSKVMNTLEPETVHDAIKLQRWNSVMQAKYEALMKNGTLKLLELPPGKKANDSKWVFKAKYKIDGTLDKHKARLVSKRFSQEESIDYEETFAPTTKMKTISFYFAMVAQFDWKVHQMDVKNTFLNGDLEE